MVVVVVAIVAVVLVVVISRLVYQQPICHVHGSVGFDRQLRLSHYHMAVVVVCFNNSSC